MRFFIFVIVLLLAFSSAKADEGKSYVTDSIKIININNPHREAEAWAMCAAAYDITAELVKESMPERAKQLGELANGAELAVIISMVMNSIDDDITNEEFYTAWNFSKISGAELPKSMRTAMLADFESDDTEGKSKFLADLGRTNAVCANNLQGQQAYIDAWRELATSGLFQFPKE